MGKKTDFLQIVNVLVVIFLFCSALPTVALSAELEWPADCVPGSDCSIGYPDTDDDDQAFDCGDPGYQGHQGTDIGITWPQMDNGVDVYAAADGEVLWVFDGKYDRCPDSNEPDCQEAGYVVCTEVGQFVGDGTGTQTCSWCFAGGNVVVIRHFNTSRVFATRYDHLRTNSILVSPGEIVSQGQKIAEIGSAGASTGPHLHFEVWGTGFYELEDPWAGSCGPNFFNSLWENEPPVCDANGPYVTECQGATTDVSLDGTGTSDPDIGDELSYLWLTACPGGNFDDFTLETPVLTVDTSSAITEVCNAELNVDDRSGGSNFCTSTVTIQDTTPPSITCPSDVTIECYQSTDPTVTGTASATDICDSSVTVNFSDSEVPGTCSGELTVTRTWTAIDSSGNTSACVQTIEAADTTPPVIETLSVSPDVLWPSNHKLIPITAIVIASDNCDSNPTVALASITMNESDETLTYDPLIDSTLGDGNTIDDIQVDTNGNISLRAERSGTGTGRIYTITYSATDCSGNSSTADVAVTVPHNK